MFGKLIKQQPGYLISWFFTSACDKGCPYCIEAKNLKKDDTLNNLKLINAIIETDIEEYTLELCGGEPSIHPEFIDCFNLFCETFQSDTNKKLIITTHGDIDIDKFKLLDNHNKQEITISITYHPSQVDFDQWSLKLKEWEKLGNVVIIALVPFSKIDQVIFFKNLGLLDNYYIQVKYIYDYTTSDIRKDYFKSVQERVNELNLKHRDRLPKISFAINDEVIDLDYDKSTLGLVIEPNKTFCKNFQIYIKDNRIMPACDESNYIEFTIADFNKKLMEAIKKFGLIICKNKICRYQIQFNEIRIPMTKKIKEYLNDSRIN